MVNIFELEPTTVSKNLRGVIVSLYGLPKTGKTSTAVKFPKSLLLAGEIGFNALAGIKAQPIQKWSEFKTVLKQLAKPEAKDHYETIILDTVDIFYDLAETFICNREGVDVIGDIPYGGGYKMLKKEFNDSLRSIPMMGFGLVMISHAQIKTVTDSSGNEYSKTMLSLADRPRGAVTGMADIIGYAEGVEVDGVPRTVLHLRDTPRFEAGSRWTYMSSVIPFEYNALVEDYVQAVEKEAAEKGISIEVGERTNNYKKHEEVSFDDLKGQVDSIIAKLMEDPNNQEKTAGKIKKVIESHLGKGKLLKELNEDQRDHLELILDDLKAI
jgi:hypothetical protein